MEHQQQTPAHKDLVVAHKDAQEVQEWVELKHTIYLEVKILIYHMAVDSPMQTETQQFQILTASAIQNKF